MLRHDCYTIWRNGMAETPLKEFIRTGELPAELVVRHIQNDLWYSSEGLIFMNDVITSLHETFLYADSLRVEIDSIITCEVEKNNLACE